MNKPQVILDEVGNPAFAVIPWLEYERMSRMKAEEGLSDEELYDLALAEAEETFPIDVADRLLDGENPLKVYRGYRGLTQKALAQAAGINAVYLSQIETGRRTGSAKTLAALAAALSVDIDDLI